MLGKKKYYYNIKTHQVEEGRQSSWTELMGPYSTREAAEHALDLARERTQAWDAGEQGQAGLDQEAGPEQGGAGLDDTLAPDWGTPPSD